MNLSTEQEEDILKLHGRGLSQNAISRDLKIPKPYVSAIIKLSQRGINGAEQAEQITGSGLPVSQRPVVLPAGGSEALYYTKRSLQDAEGRISELKQELTQKIFELETLRKEHSLLQIDHNSQQAKHNVELEKRDMIIDKSKNGGLNGFADKVLNHDKIIDGLFALATAKLAGAPAVAHETQGSDHPQISDPQVSSMLSDLIQGLNHFEKEKLRKLHELFSIFLNPSLSEALDQTHTQVTEFVKTLNPQ